MVLNEPFLWGSQSLNYLTSVTIEKNYWSETNNQTKKTNPLLTWYYISTNDRVRLVTARSLPNTLLSEHQQLSFQSYGTLLICFHQSLGHGYKWHLQSIHVKRGIITKHHNMTYIGHSSFLWMLENSHKKFNSSFENFVIYLIIFYSW